MAARLKKNVRNEIRQYVLQRRKEDSSLSGADCFREIQEKFNIDITNSSFYTTYWRWAEKVMNSSVKTVEKAVMKNSTPQTVPTIHIQALSTDAVPDGVSLRSALGHFKATPAGNKWLIEARVLLSRTEALNMQGMFYAFIFPEEKK